MSKILGNLSSIIEALAGKGSDLVISFENLKVSLLRGEEEKPSLSLNLTGSIRLDVVYVKE
ncbi:MAG: hypothetical protein QXI32_02805 [Candidatus Bathyarchaeia archaeon]